MRYRPYLCTCAERRPPPPSNDKMKRVKGEIDSVTNVMRDNIGKVLERGERLEDLEDRSEHLASTSMAFHRGARKLQRKFWWQNCQRNLIIAAVVAIILIIIIVPIAVKYSKK
eukprot:m.32077 g.32077  ORF g.32077 m.32077 type:complete len:113 (+) comp4954_c0_seq1:219-557(+)